MAQAEIEYGRYYYTHDCGVPYERNEHWLGFFGTIADRIVTDLAPTSTLDAGCAWGFLVEALVARGVDAWGVDVSEYAIAQVDASVADRCWRASLVEGLPRRYDLVTCIEVLEHMPGDEADQALANLCAAADTVLFSSTPADYQEATHVNIRPPEEWAARFARHGFVRDLDFDASFVTPWAVCYRRGAGTLPDVVRAYERAVARLGTEVGEVRAGILDLHARLERAGDDAADELAAVRQELTGAREEMLAAREDLLAARDTAATHEARLGDALGRVRELEAEIVRYQEGVERLDAILDSRSWRLLTRAQRARDSLRGGQP